MLINDCLAPYVKLGALSDTSYASWLVQRFDEPSDRILTCKSGVRSLLRRKDADSQAFSREIWELELVVSKNGNLNEHLQSIANQVSTGTIVTCLVDSSCTELLTALQDSGAIVRGSNVSWGFTKEVLKTVSLEQDSNSLLLTEDLHDSFSACVRSSFGGYKSHYHADESISEYASEVYISYICDAADKGTEVVVTLDSSGAVVAFTTMDQHEQINGFLENSKVGGGADSGVCKEAQKGGWYSKNIRAALAQMLAQDRDWFVFGTAASNFAIQRTWIRLGLYFPLRFAYRLHWKI